MATQEEFRIAVLHQAAPTPAIGGVLKPVKPGGYKDSCADLAYALFLESHEERNPAIKLITPTPTPDPSVEADWSFGDHKETILEVIEKHNANVLWANTNVHSTHALLEVAKHHHPDILMVGQDPRQVDKYDDKGWVSHYLQSFPDLEDSFPKTRVIQARDDDDDVLGDPDAITFPFPAIVKPVRGRGSQGVVLCHSRDELRRLARELWETGDHAAVVVEEYCPGEEITVTVLPPGAYEEPVGVKREHWALPVVRRFDHVDGIMPYSGSVPVTTNSCLVPLEEAAGDPAYRRIQRRCELAGKALGTLATIRLDARRRGQGKDAEFALFDVNMKPNITGPGRPGRDAQMALTALAAEGLGSENHPAWYYYVPTDASEHLSPRNVQVYFWKHKPEIAPKSAFNPETLRITALEAIINGGRKCSWGSENHSRYIRATASLLSDQDNRICRPPIRSADE